ncbi:MAG: PAC2 family protein [Chitinispirillaceae bacterium]|nr:PAC2 family protein [Chitinispirillaceae bacterium]
MAVENLIIDKPFSLSNGTLVVGFSGWMDGGEASSGSINYLIEFFKATQCAMIAPEGFYVYNFHGDMEVSNISRPFTRIANGLIEEFKFPENAFFCSQQHNLAFFLGKEPDLEWDYFGDCIYDFCKEFGITTVYCCGSVAGLTPHTREPRIGFVASGQEFRDQLQQMGLRPSNYEGPAGIMTYLINRASFESIQTANVIAEIPAYVQGYNPRSIETVVKLFARILDLKVDLDEIHKASMEFEEKISELVSQQDELPEKVAELERDYDREAFDREMGEMKNWLGRQGLRFDKNEKDEQ